MQAENLVKEVRIQRVCASCRKIELRCKCGAPNIQEVEAVYWHPAPIEQQPEEIQKAAAEEEARRQKIIQEKFAKKEAKRQRNEELMRVMNLDPEDLEKEKDKKSEERKILEKAIVKRAAEYAERVAKKKAELEGSGMHPKKARLALKKFKRMLKAENNPEVEALPELEAPMKDPVTGKFYSSEVETTGAVLTPEVIEKATQKVMDDSGQVEDLDQKKKKGRGRPKKEQ